jgi:hypothetical protein
MSRLTVFAGERWLFRIARADGVTASSCLGDRDYENQHEHACGRNPDESAIDRSF